MKKILQVIWDNIETIYYRTKFKLVDNGYYVIKRYLINIYKFRKELSNAYPWNENYGLLRRQIELMCECKRNGHEIEHHANKKVTKMERVIFLLKCFEEDNFIELAEKELGYEFKRGDISSYFVETTCDDEIYDDLSEDYKIKLFGENYKNVKLYKYQDNDSDEIQQNNEKISKLSREIEKQYWIELWDIMKGQDYTKFDKNIDFDKQFDGSGYNCWWD